MYRAPGTCSAGGSSASSLPRSTSTVRGSLPCWITPATMSPSRPAYSPKVTSSSTSRSRCKITFRAVVAAIRPNPAGVSSYSRAAAPVGPDGDVPAVPVYLDARGRRRALRLVVGHEQGVLDGLDREVERDIFLALQTPQHAQVNVHRESLQAPLAGARTPPGWLQRRARRNRSGGFSAHPQGQR